MHCHCHQPVLGLHILRAHMRQSTSQSFCQLPALKFRWQLLHCPKSLWDTSGGLMPRPWREKIVKHVKKIVSNVRNQQSSSPVVLNTFFQSWASTMIVITTGINYNHLLNSPSILIPNALPIGRRSLLSQAYQLRVPEKVVQPFPASRCAMLCLESTNKQSSPRLISLR